jgi:hypothetical protein
MHLPVSGTSAVVRAGAPVNDDEAEDCHSIAEMAGGWGSKVMQDEPSFIVLDGCMVLIAVTLLSFIHPGIFFPQMATPRKPAKGDAEHSSDTPPMTAEEPKVAESA